jgi:hypothetical protein
MNKGIQSRNASVQILVLTMIIVHFEIKMITATKIDKNKEYRALKKKK